MRLVEIGFWTSNALLVSAGVAFVRTQFGAPAPHRGSTVADSIHVVSFHPKEICSTSVEPAHDASAGWISFRPGADETVLGIVAAKSFPIENGAPALEKGAELSAAQLGVRIDTKEWLERTGVPPEAFLNFDLIVRDRDGHEEYRQGWARLDVASLRTGGISVDAPARGTVTLDVRTVDGQAVPGALLVVDAADIAQSGLASQFAVTAEDGAAVLSGLEPGLKYRASLADGVGPDPRVVSIVVTGDGSRHELDVALPGKWEFLRHHLLLAVPGASTRVTEMKPQDPTCPGAWAVSRWVPPGRGFDAPFWVMSPASDAARAMPMRLVFAHRDGLDVPDLRRPVRLAFSPFTHDVKLIDAPSVAATSASPAAPSSPR